MVSRILIALMAFAVTPLAAADTAALDADLANLGRALFFDPRLSNDRTMSLPSPAHIKCKWL